MYDRTGLSTKCTLIKTGFKNARTGTKAKFRPFVDALCVTELKVPSSGTSSNFDGTGTELVSFQKWWTLS